MGCVYKVTNKRNNKIYIGKTIYSLEHRRSRHFSDAKLKRTSTYFHSALRKYDDNDFEWSILIESNSDDFLKKKEIDYIKTYQSDNREYGYNLTKGGDGSAGYCPSKETREKVSKIQKGLKRSKITRKRLSESKKGDKNPNYGKKIPLSVRKKMSKSSQTNYPGSHFRKDRNPEKKCWQCTIGYNGFRTYLGTFEDPISAMVVYSITFEEIYK